MFISTSLDPETRSIQTVESYWVQWDSMQALKIDCLDIKMGLITSEDRGRNYSIPHTARRIKLRYSQMAKNDTQHNNKSHLISLHFLNLTYL